MASRTIVIFGAGAIGRGMLGELADSAGLCPVFVEADAELGQRLQRAKGYVVNLTGKMPAIRRVDYYDVLHSDESERIAAAVAECVFAATAVGGQNLIALAPLIASSLKARSTPLNILVCENLSAADTILARALIENCVDANRFTCVRCSVERMVCKQAGSIDLLAESEQSLFVDARAWKGPRIEIEGFNFSDNIDALYARKLFTNNAGQALLAYGGYRAGCRLIHQALEISEILRHLTEMLDIACRVLELQFGLDGEGLIRHADDLITWRFGNRALVDPISRVARNPLRKLGPKERLVGLIRLLQQYGLPTRDVSLVIADAMHYRDADDPECLELERIIVSSGPEAVLREVCGLCSEGDQQCFAECIAFY